MVKHNPIRGYLSTPVYLGTNPNYWVQSNGYWGSGEASSGDEAVAVTWENVFAINNNTSTNIIYSYFNSTAGMTNIEPYKGVAWQFTDGISQGGDYNYLFGIYAGASVTRVGSYGRHYFTSEYVHTYSSTSFTAQITSDLTKLTGATLTLTPSPSSWKLVSYVVGDF